MINLIFISILNFISQLSANGNWCLDEQDFLKVVPYAKYFEKAQINTQDGYVLQIFRIRKNQDSKAQPILFNHSLELSSDQWFSHPYQSIGKILYEQGYDLWFMNQRGNKYSCWHQKYNLNDKQFWDFSISDIAEYDTPTALNYVYQVTQQKVITIGHSQGAGSFLCAFSEDIKLQKKVKKLISISQATAMFDIENHYPQLYKLASSLPYLYTVLQKAGFYSFLSQDVHRSKLVYDFLRLGCYYTSVFCEPFYKIIFTKTPENMLYKELPDIFYKTVSPRSSFKCVEHYRQSVVRDSDRMHKFDYGKKKNLEIYGQEIPPYYDFTKVKVPTYVYYGDSDQINTPKDNKNLIKFIGKQAHERFFKDYGHISWFWGKNIEQFIEQFLSDIKE